MPKDWEPDWTAAEGWHIDITVAGRRIRRRLGIRDVDSKAIARKAAEAVWREAWDSHLNPVAPKPPGPGVDPEPEPEPDREPNRETDPEGWEHWKENHK